MLAPLGVYNLDDGSVNMAELYAIGGALDDCAAEAMEIERESVVPTAEEYGLTNYETILATRPVREGAEVRRSAIRSLLLIDDASFTPGALNSAVSGCGISAEVRETEKKYTVKVNFPDTRGIPDNTESIMSRIEQILPCHLDIKYEYLFPTWEQIEAAFPRWNIAETENVTWQDLERYVPPEK